jgi:heme exporter protein C
MKLFSRQQWFYQMASPRWFYDLAGKLLPWFSIAAGVLLLAGGVWGLAFAPSDYQQGNSFRIIYVHVPAAILSQSCYLFMAVTGGIGLVWKIKLAHVIAKCCAPVGASMTVLALATGAIWGKPTWGTWWVWDARLTSMLILLFLYLGVIALSEAFSTEKGGDNASAVLALVGLVNIPIIKYSVEWWNTLHQPATFKLTAKPAMAPEMWLPLLVMVLGFYCFFAAVLLLRVRLELLHRERKTQWVSLIVEQSR